jgi:hypothetical protein
MMIEQLPVWIDCPYSAPEGIIVRLGYDHDRTDVIVLHDEAWNKYVGINTEELDEDAFLLACELLIRNRRAKGWGWEPHQLRLSAANAWRFAAAAKSVIPAELETASKEKGYLCAIDGYEIYLDQDVPGDIGSISEKKAFALLAERMREE